MIPRLQHPLRSLARRSPTLTLVIAGSLLVAGLCPSPAFGKSLTRRPILTLKVVPRPDHPAELTLVAHARQGSHGVDRKTVAFFVVSTEFKQPLNVPIGTAETAAGGSARLDYVPTWSGEQRFVAKLTSPGAHAPAATASYHVRASLAGPLAAAASPARPLASVGRVFLDVLLAVVAAIWVSLIAVVALATGWMPRLAGHNAGRVPSC